MRVYHRNLTSEKWSKYAFPQQVLMIANELNRARNCLKANDSSGVDNAYTRALELVWITIDGLKKRNRRREMLRWREMLLSEYSGKKKSLRTNGLLLRTLLLLTTESAGQIKYLIND